jgi:hypothetical protein
VQPFVREPVPDQPFLDRQLRLPFPVGAEAAVVNLFADARRIQDVSVAALEQIEERHRLEEGDLTATGRSVFARLLTHCVADGEMSDDEVDALVQLKELFGLSNQEARTLHDDAAAEHYREAIDERLVDRVMSDADQAFLDRLRDRLLLSEERARQVVIESAQAILLAAEQQVSTDLTLSPSDVASLKAMASSLGVDWMQEETDQARIERLRRHWELDRLPLAVIEVDIALPAGEAAYLAVAGVRRRDLPPAGPNEDKPVTLNSDLVELLLWLFTTIGDWALSSERAKSDGLRTVDTGRLALTNRHLLFIGRRSVETVPLSKIRDVQHAPERLTVKATGRPWPLVFEGSEELAAAFVLLRRLVREDIAASTG